MAVYKAINIYKASVRYQRNLSQIEPFARFKRSIGLFVARLGMLATCLLLSSSLVGAQSNAAGRSAFGADDTQHPLVVFAASNPVPTLTSISRNRVNAGNPSIVLTVNGMNFAAGASIQFGKIALKTTLALPTQLQATLPASLLNMAGRYAITVHNPKPGGGNSNALTFAVASPTPLLNGIAPNHLVAGASDTTITLTGSNFTTATKAHFNGISLTTTFISATKLTAIIPANQLTVPGDYDISVNTPGPGGGTSTSFTFSVLPTTPKHL